MKRKIAILMASMMALTAPMNAFAAYFDASELESTRYETVSVGSTLSGNRATAIEIPLIPDDYGIEKGHKMKLTLENGNFPEEFGNQLWGSGENYEYEKTAEGVIKFYKDELKSEENLITEDDLAVTFDSFDVTLTIDNKTLTIIMPVGLDGEYAEVIKEILIDTNLSDSPESQTYKYSKDDNVNVTIKIDTGFIDARNELDDTNSDSFKDTDLIDTASGNTLKLKAGVTAEVVSIENAKSSVEDVKIPDPIGQGMPYLATRISSTVANLEMVYDINEDGEVMFEDFFDGETASDIKVSTGLILDEENLEYETDVELTAGNLNVKFEDLKVEFEGIKVSDAGDVKVTFENAKNSEYVVDSGSATIGTGIGGYVETEVTVENGARGFTDALDLSENGVELTITEISSTSFDEGGQVRLALNNGFVFDSEYVEDDENGDEILIGYAVINDSDGDFLEELELTIGSNKRYAYFNLDDAKLLESLEENIITFRGTDSAEDNDGDCPLWVVPTSDSISGEATITVTGDSISSEDNLVTIGTRGELAFSLTTPYVFDEEDDDYDEDDDTHTLAVPTIGAGRFYQISNALEIGDAEDTHNLSAVINFAEVINNSLNDGKELTFTVPEGVKIVNIIGLDNDGIVNEEYKDSLNNGTDDEPDNVVSIRNDGQTLRFAGGALEDSDNGASSMEFQLELSVDPYYATGEGLNEDGTRDITLTASNSGAEDVSVVIAKAITPFTIEVEHTDAEIGKTGASVSDIIIKENYPGAFLSGGWVTLEMAGLYGADGLSFIDADVELTVERVDGDEEKEVNDELEISNPRINLSGGANKIVFQVQNGTTEDLGTIKISNVKIASSRTVPLGSYDLQIGGEAIINNYYEVSSTNSNSVMENELDTNDLSSYDIGSGDLDRGLYSVDSENKALMNLIFHETRSVYQVSDFVTIVEEGYVGSSPDDMATVEKFEGVVSVEIEKKEIKKEVNGEAVAVDTTNMSVAPFVKTDIVGYENVPTTLVPVRAIAEAIGATIEVHPTTPQWIGGEYVYVTYADFYLLDGTKLTLNDHPERSHLVTFNDTTNQSLAIPVQNIEGRFCVPLRALGDLLGINVWWENGTNAGGDAKFGPKGTAFYYSTLTELNAFLKKYYNVVEEVEAEDVQVESTEATETTEE